ncbi:MAG TPA: hypothetical protein VKT22_16080 [Steroidobacteraceae bacterium]|nr:hypothetical protein [Steroidobacteraceae bacterium]
MVLRGLQALLGRLYDVPLEHDVYDFLVTDRSTLSHVDPHPHGEGPEEELLLAESADGVRLSLYIDAQVVERLERSNPLGELNEENIVDFCTALEGVSHFVYCAWRLEGDAPVSLLELETQAEVDKYAAAVFLLGHQLGGAYPSQVHPRLFNHVAFDHRLEPEQHARYRTAHRCAANYCRRLESRFVSRGRAQVEALVRELRRFYRMGSAAKLRHALA